MGIEEPLTGTLLKWYEFFLPQIERLTVSIRSPRVLRILAEDTAFRIAWFLESFQTTYAGAWRRYVAAAQTGNLLAPEYRRCVKCGQLMRLLLEHSCANEVTGPDEKSRQYAYAISELPLPDWFRPEEIVGGLDEMVTVYALACFSALDYDDEWRMDMDGYLTPEIEKAVVQLAQTCDDLTRQVLIRELTRKTQEWCKGDPELAEILLEGKKSLESCVKYVLEQAARVVAKNVSAMPKVDLDTLPTQMIDGKKATMAGNAVSAEQAFQWARDYYYKVKETKTNGGKGKTGNPGKKADKKKPAADAAKGKGAAGAKAVTDAAPAPAKNENGGVPEQLTLGGQAA